MRQDSPDLVELAGRERLLAATGHHPYVRLTTASAGAGGGLRRAFVSSGAAVWLASWSRRVVASGFGEPDTVAALLARLADRGELDAVRRVNLPRIDHGALAACLAINGIDDWDFRWTRSAPPTQPGQQRVVRLGSDHHAAIEALLDRAFPETFTRPGDPMVRRWYGVWDGDRLVACGADRSRDGVGSISAVAVDPAVRGRGLGGALTAAMARHLLADCDVVTLGVITNNHRADRLYRRLGFADAIGRTSANLTR